MKEEGEERTRDAAPHPLPSEMSLRKRPGGGSPMRKRNLREPRPGAQRIGLLMVHMGNGDLRQRN